jgi:hypothetical protein
MADAPVVHIGENSPEEVALKLFNYIAAVEGRALYIQGDKPADREWILRTYNQCISVVARSANVGDVVGRYNPGR